MLLFGGANINSLGFPEYLNDLRQLDTESMTWSRIGANGTVPSPRYSHSAALVGSNLIIYGGWGKGGLQDPDENQRKGSCVVAVFDVESGKWFLPQFKDETLVHKYGHSCFRLDDNSLVIFGGWDGKLSLYRSLVFLCHLFRNTLSICNIDIDKDIYHEFGYSHFLDAS